MVRHMGMDFAWKMRGKWTTERLRGNWPIEGRDRCDLFDSACCLQLFELQLQLFDLTEDLLALRAEEHALQLLDQQYKRSEEHTSELQSLRHLVCRLLLEKKK